jgi:hypothetical protein
MVDVCVREQYCINSGNVVGIQSGDARKDSVRKEFFASESLVFIPLELRLVCIYQRHPKIDDYATLARSGHQFDTAATDLVSAAVYRQPHLCFRHGSCRRIWCHSIGNNCYGVAFGE